MKRFLRLGVVAGLGLALTLPPLEGMAASSSSAPDGHGSEVELARGGGRGGGGRGGGGSRGGGSRSGRSSGGRTGFSSYGGGGSSYRGNRSPSGGWSSGSRSTSAGTRQQGRQDTRAGRTDTRQSTRTERTGTRQATRTDRTDTRQSTRTDRADTRQSTRSDRADSRSDRVSDRTDVRRDRIDNRWDNNWAGWARPGWRAARPWVGGWYGNWASPSWGWWGARSVAWGVGALATGAIITDLVDDAINDEVTYITVPDTSYELYYTSVAPAGSDAVTFAVDTGSGVVEMTADCRQGTLNGRVPETAAEAQLLNAACEVAYGD